MNESGFRMENETINLKLPTNLTIRELICVYCKHFWFDIFQVLVSLFSIIHLFCIMALDTAASRAM